jgi:regulator of sirC expression with transglutaminase-like and TPR domain
LTRVSNATKVGGAWPFRSEGKEMRAQATQRTLSGLIAASVLLYWLAAAMPERAAASNGDPLRPLRALLQAPEIPLDLATAKLEVDRLIDPSIDRAQTLRQIETLAARIRARIPAGASRRMKLEILVHSFTQPGPWNDFRPFRYDLDDPFGDDIRNKLLSTYLATRKGNCVSMPILFVIVSQKVGLEATLSTAPRHVFARVKTDEGTWFNVEVTSFGAKTDSRYRTDFRITPRAVDSGIYLRTLSRRQSLGVVFETLMEHDGKTGRQERRMALADLVLRLDSKNVAALLHKGSACARLIKARYSRRYPSPDQISEPQRRDFETLARCNLDNIAKAEALGWREETAAENAAYRRSIEQAKTNQGETR